MNRKTPDDARENLAQRIRDWATRLDVRVQAVTIRKMQRKWASCSTACDEGSKHGDRIRICGNLRRNTYPGAVFAPV